MPGRDSCPGESSTGPPSDEPTFTERILVLLDRIHAMDEAPAATITNIGRLIAEDNNDVSVAEVARRLIDQIDGP